MLHDHKFKRKWNWDAKVPFLSLSGFPFADTDDSQDSKERDVIIFIPTYTPTHDHSDIYGQLSI